MLIHSTVTIFTGPFSWIERQVTSKYIMSSKQLNFPSNHTTQGQVFLKHGHDLIWLFLRRIWFGLADLWCLYQATFLSNYELQLYFVPEKRWKVGLWLFHQAGPKVNPYQAERVTHGISRCYWIFDGLWCDQLILLKARMRKLLWD